VLTIEIRWSSYGLTFKHALWCTHLLGSLKVLAFKEERALVQLVRFESTQTQEGG